MKPIEITAQFDQLLHEHNKRFDAVCIGGTALGLLGIISPETRDCDVLGL